MKSNLFSSSRTAVYVNYFSVFIGSWMPRATTDIKIRRVSWILLLLCLFTGVSKAQQPQSNIILELGRDDLREWAEADDTSADIIIELKNVNRPSESAKRIRLIATPLPQEPKEEGDKIIDVEQGQSYPLAQNTFLNDLSGSGLVLKIADTSWSAGVGTITFKGRVDQPYAFIKLSVEPAKYQLTAKVTNGNWTTTIVDITQDYVENQKQIISLKAPTFFGGIWKKLISSEGLLGAIIAALVATLIGVLKDKIKAVFNRLLDFLGKYLGGRLAEKRFLKRYIDNLSFNHKYLKLIGFNTGGISRPLLEEVFISLRIASNSLTVVGGKKDEGQDTSAISFNSAFKQNQYMAILGGPGAGKTTTLSYALLMFAQKKAEEKFGIKEELLPIYIPLRRLSNSTRSIIEDLTDKDRQILSSEILKECPQNYFERKLKKGQCLVLLDGLDEVTNERTHRQVAERINSLVAAYPDNRFVVTCRNAGWKDLLSGEFKVLWAQDFNRDEIQRFVLGWHKAVITQSEYSRLQLDVPDKKKFEEKWEAHKEEFVKPAIDIQSRRLIHAIDSNNRILAIAVNPMLLSLISLVHYNRQYLPRGRTLLYSQCIELLIDSWDRTRDILFTGSKVTAVQKEAVLREIAFDFQVKGKGEDSRDNLEQLIKEIAHKLGISMSAKELLEDIETRSGLLVERSIDVFGFSHLTLQEYLVARHIQLNQSNYGLLTANFDKQEWREVILLYTGLIDDATELIKGASSADSLDRQILAGYCIGDAQHCDSKVSEEIIDSLSCELNKNSNRTDEIINVMSAIATDFSNEAVSVEEKLSNKLINISRDANAPKSDRLTAISILGGARITQALNSLILLMHLADADLRGESIKAIVLFGNLALPEIEEHLNTYPRIHDDDLLFAEPIIEVLSGINTGQAARLLMRLYDLNNPVVDLQVSYKLSQMLMNTFVEADLREMEVAQLPISLRGISIDRSGWSYKSAKSAFWLIDTKLRSDMLRLLSDPYAMSTIALSKESTGFRDISFKVLFPAFLSYLRNFPDIYINSEENKDSEHKFSILKKLGFDETEPNKIHYLVNQINKSFAIPLDLALQNISNSKTSDYSYKTTKGVKVIVWLSNIYFTIFYLAVLYYAVLSLNEIFWLYSEVPFRYRTLFITESILQILPLLFYSGIILVTKYKLKKGYLTKKFFGLVLSPIANFLKVLPYLTRRKSRTKLLSFQLLVLLFSTTGVLTFVLFYGYIYSPNSFHIAFKYYAQDYGMGIIFLVLSSLYWKYYVLSQNLVSQLILMHPQGRKIVSEGNI